MYYLILPSQKISKELSGTWDFNMDIFKDILGAVEHTFLTKALLHGLKYKQVFV